MICGFWMEFLQAWAGSLWACTFSHSLTSDGFHRIRAALQRLGGAEEGMNSAEGFRKAGQFFCWTIMALQTRFLGPTGPCDILSIATLGVLLAITLGSSHRDGCGRSPLDFVADPYAFPWESLKPEIGRLHLGLPQCYHVIPQLYWLCPCSCILLPLLQLPWFFFSSQCHTTFIHFLSHSSGFNGGWIPSLRCISYTTGLKIGLSIAACFSCRSLPQPTTRWRGTVLTVLLPWRTDSPPKKQRPCGRCRRRRPSAAMVYHIRCNMEITWNYDELCSFPLPDIHVCISRCVSIQTCISV